MDTRVRLSFLPGAKGNGVTRIEKLNLHPRLKEIMLQEMKRRLGCGGSVKEGALELQGDHRDFVEAELAGRGYKVRRIG